MRIPIAHAFRFFFIAATLVSGISLANSKTEDLYSIYLLSAETVEVKLAAKAVHGDLNTSQQLADLTAEVLVRNVTGSNSLDIDTQAWLAKALGNLKRGRYLRALETAEASSQSRKLSGYIKKAIKQLPASVSDSYIPGSMPLDKIRGGLAAKQRNAALGRANSPLGTVNDEETLSALLNRLGLPDSTHTVTGQIGIRGVGASWAPSRINVQQMLLIYKGIGEVQLARANKANGEWASYFTVNYQGNQENSLSAYRKMLSVNDPRGFGNRMVKLRSQQPRVPALLDLLAERLHQSYTDKQAAPGLTHIAVILGGSQNPRYRSVLERASSASPSSGVRKWCKRALKQIPTTTEAQYQPGSAQL